MAVEPWEVYGGRDFFDGQKLGLYYTMYYNMYDNEGCGMPSKEALWNSKCDVDQDGLSTAFTEYRAGYQQRELGEDGVTLIDKLKNPVLMLGDGSKGTLKYTYNTMHATLGTLGCASTYVRANREKSHGVDMLELIVWLHQLSEYSFDVDLETLVTDTTYNMPPML
jgi:hypothetical protein